MEIMSIGRWTSMAAILYITGSIEDQVTASDSLGKGSLSYQSGHLHKAIGTSLTKDLVPTAPTDRWARHVATEMDDAWTVKVDDD